MTYLKLAVSIQSQPILTEQRPTEDAVPSFAAAIHGMIRSGSMKPLSLANCSRQMGRKSVSDTTTKTSLPMPTLADNRDQTKSINLANA